MLKPPSIPFEIPLTFILILKLGTLHFSSCVGGVSCPSVSECVLFIVPGPVLTKDPGSGAEIGPTGETAMGVPFSEVDGHCFGIELELRFELIRLFDFVLKVLNERFINAGLSCFLPLLSFSSIACLKLFSLSSDEAEVDGVGKGELDLCNGSVKIGGGRFVWSAELKS